MPASEVSSDEQVERGSIENQLDFARKYCDLHQLNVVVWYKDDGVTGTISLDQRPEGNRLVEDAKAGVFDLLLVYRLDRFGRSARIILNAVYDLEQYGVKIRSMTEPFDTGDPSGRFLLTILAGVADLERETILERLWLGANRAARDGKWLGGIVPYGYLVNPEGFLEINDAKLPGFDISESDIVRLIFNLTNDRHYSTIKIADYLNALKVPTSYVKDSRQVKQGKRKVNTAGVWLPGRVNQMLKNTTYKGIHYYGKRTNKKRDLIPREVPAIVSAEVWDEAQLVLKDNQLESMKNSTRQYLLRGLIKCGSCGLTYYGVAYNGPGRGMKAYYVCGGKISYRGPLQGKCQSKNIPTGWIEKVVWDQVEDFIRNPGEALDELAASMEGKKSHKVSLEAEYSMLTKVIEEKDSERQRILDLFRKKIINSRDVENQLQQISQEKLHIEHQLRELQDRLGAEETLSQGVNSAGQLLAVLRSKLDSDPPHEIKREIIKTLVKSITIHTKTTETGRLVASCSAIYSFFQRYYSHGQGFIAPTIWNRAGKITEPAARDTVTIRSSNG